MDASQITIYFSADGTATVRIPKGVIPDRTTLERVAYILKNARKEAAA